jgi:chromosome segregation ATPase
METEKFQDLVLEHLARLTQETTELKTGQNELKGSVEELRAGQNELKGSVEELRAGQNELKGSVEELRAGQNELKGNVEELRAGLQKLETGQQELKVGQERIESKLDVVHNHTAKLTEDLTVTNQKLDAWNDDVKYLKYKEAQNEADLFKVKSYLKITE